jgi:hypothetical protein
MSSRVRRLAGRQFLWAVLALLGCGDHSGTGIDSPAPVMPVPWTPDVWTQPVPSWGASVRLNLPVALNDIVLGVGGGLGGYGAHQGAHVEGLNHVWIPTRPGTIVRSWSGGTVTKIEDMGDRGTGDGRHEFFITIDYGRGLVGKHLDVDVPLVKVGDTVKEGDPVANAPSAEIMLIDNNRTDGERSGGLTGSPVSPFDYLRDDVKAALIARHVAEVVEPFFRTGAVAGNSRPWEPYLTNPMLFHSQHRGTIVGEWILINKNWSRPDPVYFDVMAIFDVTNTYGHFQKAELMDHDWSASGNKRGATASWASPGGTGTMVFSIERGATWYGLFTVDESGGRARLTMEWKQGSYPTVLSSNAAVYVERAPIYLQGDAQALGLVK